MSDAAQRIKPKKEKKNASRISPALWGKHKQEIYQLYKVQGWTKERVLQYLKTQHKFRPSPRQLGLKFEEWKWRKYRSGNGGHSLEIPTPSTLDPTTGSVMNVSRAFNVPSIGTRPDEPQFGTRESSMSTDFEPRTNEQKMNLARGWFTSLHDDEFAYLLCRDWYSKLDCHHDNLSEKMNAVIACARSAHKAEHFGQVEAMTNSILKLSKKKENFSAVELELNLLKMLVSASIEIEPETPGHSPHILEVDHLHSLQPSPNGFALDVVMIQLLLHSWQRQSQFLGKPHSVSRTQQLDMLVQQQLSGKAGSNGTKAYECILGCVKWCLDQLGRQHLKPSVDIEEAARTLGKDSMWAEEIVLFSSLWNQLPSAQHTDDTPTCRWIDNTNQVLGIFSAELLFVTVSLILHNSTEHTPRTGKSEELIDWEDLRCAAETMVGLGKEGLCLAFVRRFLEINSIEEGENTQDDDNEFRPVWEQARRYIRTELGIPLPALDGLSDDESTTTDDFNMMP